MTLYALLVGINEYRPPVPPLRGCVADVEAFATLLRARRAGDLEVRSLLDADATRAGFVDAVRTHLGRAGEHDVALLYFAGHGSEEPVPAELSHLESGDRLQTLVLVDTGQLVDGHVVRPLHRARSVRGRHAPLPLVPAGPSVPRVLVRTRLPSV